MNSKASYFESLLPPPLKKSVKIEDGKVEIPGEVITLIKDPPVSTAVWRRMQLTQGSTDDYKIVWFELSVGNWVGWLLCQTNQNTWCVVGSSNTPDYGPSMPVDAKNLSALLT